MSVLAAVGQQVGDFRDLLHSRNYRLLWAAQIVSTFGDRLTQVALAALIYSLTRSEVGLGLALSLTMLPQAAFSVFAGVAADRSSRKALLVTTDLVRAAAMLVLALWVGIPLVLVYVITLIHATGTVFFAPTRYALLPDVVDHGKLLAANALDETSQNTVDPVAYLCAGFLVSAAGVQLTFGLDAFTFVTSAGLIGAMALQHTTRRSEYAAVPHRLRRDLAEGFRFVWRTPALRANTLLVMSATLAASAEFPLSYMMVFDHWRRGTVGLGIIEAALALGIIAGGFICGAAVAAWGRGPTVLVGLAGTAVAMVEMAALPFPLAVVAIACSGVFNVLYFVPTVTLMQELAPEAIRGRVLSSRRALTAVTIFTSYMMATALVSTVPAQVLMSLMGVALLAVALTGFAFPVLRQR